MKRSTQIVTGLATCLTVLGISGGPARGQGAWRGFPLAFPRKDHTATKLSNGNVLLVGGNPCNGLETDGSATAEIVDPSRGRSEPLPPLKVPRREHTASLIGRDRVVVVGGDGPARQAGLPGVISTVEILSRDQGAWRWQGGPSLRHPRRAHAAVVLRDGRLVVLGGMGELAEPLASIEILSADGKQWTDAGSLAAPCAHARAHLLRDGRILVLADQDHAEVWDPSSKRTGKTIASPGLHGPRGPMTTVELTDGRILVAGPDSSPPGPRAVVKTWNPRSQTWSLASDLPAEAAGFSALYWPQAVRLGDDVIFVGEDAVEAFSAHDRTWRHLEPSLVATYGATVTPIGSNDALLLAGGHIGRCDLAEIWRRDERPTGRWAPAGHDGQALVVLKDGRVLTVSAVDANHLADSRTTRTWDPKTHALGAPARMLRPRRNFSTTLLPDGRVLVAGGYDDNDVAEPKLDFKAHPDRVDTRLLTSTEIYSTSTNRWTPGPPLKEAREDADIVTLPSGHVLVLNGTYDLDTCGNPPNGFACRIAYGRARDTEELLAPPFARWQIAGRQPASQPGATIALLTDGRVLSVGGEPDGRAAAMFDAKAATWTKIALLDQPRFQAGTTVLADGQVLVVGGSWTREPQPGEIMQRHALATAETWSPATDAWTATASLNIPATVARAVTLKDGRAMVMGLVSETTPRPTTPELWDPAGNRWTPTGARPRSVSQCLPLLLPTGEVLACGYVWTAN
jgi:hypothetical protein